MGLGTMITVDGEQRHLVGQCLAESADCGARRQLDGLGVRDITWTGVASVDGHGERLVPGGCEELGVPKTE